MTVIWMMKAVHLQREEERREGKKESERASRVRGRLCHKQ
jgi:hypothetical protein